MKKLDDLRRGAEATLLTDVANVSWLTGFTGDSSCALILPDNAYFITDFRYVEQAQREVASAFSIVEMGRMQALCKLLKGVRALAIDFENTSLAEAQQYREVLSVQLQDRSADLRCLRAIKTDDEIARMRRGAKLTQDAFFHVLSYVKEGVSESDVCAELLYFFHKRGAEPSFAPIIASGENASMPHAGVTNRRFSPGDFITMDFGCKYEGVCTDFTRTIALFGVAERQKMIYNIVNCAQKAGLAALRAGVLAGEADAAARGTIEKAGFAACFGHGLGHGVGVEIHESPRLAPTSEDVLAEGMVVTVEPGIYLPGIGGVRIEDTCLITETGCEVLFAAPKALQMI